MAIDNCKVSDAALANILAGVASHNCVGYEKNGPEIAY